MPSDPYAGIGAVEAPANDPYAGIAVLEPKGGDPSSVGRNKSYDTTYRGKKYTFLAPDDATEDDLKRLSVEAIGQADPRARTAPFVYKKPGAPSDSSALRAIGLGLLKPLDNLSLAASNIPYIGPAVDSFGQAIGMPSTQDAVAGNKAERANNSRTGYQTLGNIAGTLPTMMLPGGAVVQGGASGALLTDKTDAFGVAEDALIGGAVGKGVSAIGSMLSPVVSKGARALSDAGVPLTLGQIGKTSKGGMALAIRNIEGAARKLPFLKNVVLNAEDRGVLGNYKAVFARTGVKVPDNIEPGHETTDFVARKLGEQYQALLPRMSVAADNKLASGLSKVESNLKAIAPSVFSQFQSILKHAGLQGKAAQINGKTFQQADRVLRTQAERFGNSIDPNQQEMGAAFNAVREQMRGLLMRQNPQHAAELSALNKSFREFAVARKAAGDPNKGTGIFTPARYATAAKGSRSNREFTRAADQILPNRLPDSGTTEGVVGGQLAAAALGGGAALKIAPIAAIPAAGSLLYTKLGQSALNKAYFATRPGAVRVTGNTLKKLSALAPAVVPSKGVADDR